MDTWGFVTETDLIGKVVAGGMDPESITMHEIMSKPVITVSLKSSLQEYGTFLTRANILGVLAFAGHEIV